MPWPGTPCFQGLQQHELLNSDGTLGSVLLPGKDHWLNTASNWSCWILKLSLIHWATLLLFSSLRPSAEQKQRRASLFWILPLKHIHCSTEDTEARDCSVVVCFVNISVDQDAESQTRRGANTWYSERSICVALYLPARPNVQRAPQSLKIATFSEPSVPQMSL